MATQIFRGDAPAVGQISTVQITGYDAATTYAVTCSNRIVGVPGSTNVNTTAGNLYNALVSFSGVYAEFSDFTLTYNSTDTVSFFAANPGVPFTLTAAASGGAGTLTLATPQASSGPNDWSTAANWSTGSVPVSSDDVYLQNSSVDISYGLSQSGVALTSLNILSTYTGSIGLPDLNVSGGYFEYRPKYLAVGATTINIGDQISGGSGSGRIKLSPGAHTTTLNVNGTGSPTDPGFPALIVNGSASSYTANLLSGSVGFALDVGTTATLPLVRVGYETSINTDVSLTLGSGCTITTISQYGGTVVTSAGCTTWTMTAGTGTALGSAAVTTLTVWPATGQTSQAFWESTGTIGTLVVGDNGSISFERDLRARTVTNSTLYDGAALADGFRTVTFSNATSFPGDPYQVSIGRGVNYTMQI